MTPENITLFFQQGSSDKVYQAELLQDGDAFLVNFAYGRRGATLKTGTKTQAAVPYEKAKKIYDKLVADKMGKGYLPSAEDAPKYLHETDQVQTGIHCQLLNPIEAEALEKLLENDLWWAQEKMDGKRLLLQNDTELIAINRRGLSVGAPESVLESAKTANKKFILDGEAINEHFYVFDILAFEGESLSEKSYSERLAILETLTFGEAISIVPTAKTTAVKKALYTKLKDTNTEGIVLKNSTAPYTAGRPNSGGNQMKFKFYETATVQVSKVTINAASRCPFLKTMQK